MSTKTCRKCQQAKNTRNFYKHATSARGLFSICKSCHRAVMRENQARPEGAWARYLRVACRKYGVSVIQIRTMFDQQNGQCLGCFESFIWGPESKVNGARIRMHIDHCHVSGGVRGLLCVDCNVALGRVKDNEAVLRRLAEYLQIHRAKEAACG